MTTGVNAVKPATPSIVQPDDLPKNGPTPYQISELSTLKHREVDWDRAVPMLAAIHQCIENGSLSEAELTMMGPDLEALHAKAEAENNYSALEIFGMIIAALTGIGLLIVAGGLIHDAATTNKHERAEELTRGALEKGKLGSVGLRSQGTKPGARAANLPSEADLKKVFGPKVGAAYNEVMSNPASALRYSGSEQQLKTDGLFPKFQAEQKNVQKTLAEAYDLAKKGDFGGAAALLEKLEPDASAKEGSPARLRYGMEDLKDGTFQSFAKQMRFCEAMKSAGVTVDTLPPSGAALDKYFETFKGKDPNLALAAYDQFSDAFLTTVQSREDTGGGVNYGGEKKYYQGGKIYGSAEEAGKHGDYTIVETTNPTDTSQVLGKTLVGGRHAIDCDGYAYMGARLLEKAGFKVVGFANAHRQSDGVGHSIAALTTPGNPSRPIVISSNGVLGRGRDGVTPAKAEADAKTLAREEMERMLPLHATDTVLRTFFSLGQADAMTYDAMQDRPHEMPRPRR